MNIQHSINAQAIFVAICLTSVGCIMEEEVSDEIASTSEELYVLSTSIWPTPTIPVCWENPSPANITERAWVRAATLRTWEAVSAVTFSGWGTCSSGLQRHSHPYQRFRPARKGSG